MMSEKELPMIIDRNQAAIAVLVFRTMQIHDQEKITQKIIAECSPERITTEYFWSRVPTYMFLMFPDHIRDWVEKG
jgi:hypothetical protein